MRKTERISFSRVDEIVSHLDLFSRILIGQYDEIVWKATGRMYSSRDDRELGAMLRHIRDLLIPAIVGYDLNGSLGIWSEDTPLIAKRAFDIQQCLRYQMSYHRYPEGGITVNFNRPFLHGDWTVDHMAEYHEILRNQSCGEYRKGYAIQTPWACPVILDGFAADQVDLIMDDVEVVRIIALADRWNAYVKDWRLVELFTEVQMYSDGRMRPAELERLCASISSKFRTIL